MLEPDMNAPATKQDLRSVEKRLDDKIDALGKRLAAEMVRMRGQMGDKFDAMARFITSGNSRVIQQVEGFMAQVQKIDRDQVITNYRLSEVEKRVKSLERS